jgi:hypothetical protein
MNPNKFQKLGFDEMNMADPVLVGRASMTVIDAVQDLHPKDQVLGMAATFLLLCDRYNVMPQDIFTISQNVMNGVDGKRPEFRAVKSYLAGEV